MNFWQYIATNYTEILALLLEHIKLTAISVGLAVLIICQKQVKLCYPLQM